MVVGYRVLGQAPGNEFITEQQSTFWNIIWHIQIDLKVNLKEWAEMSGIFLLEFYPEFKNRPSLIRLECHPCFVHEFKRFAMIKQQNCWYLYHSRGYKIIWIVEIRYPVSKARYSTQLERQIMRDSQSHDFVYSDLETLMSITLWAGL